MGNSKPRKTLAKQIRSIAENDIDSAISFANRGRQFTEIETMLSTYYWARGVFKKIKSGEDKSHNGRAFHVFYEWQASQLFAVLINAVNSRNATEVFELANAIKFLKDFKGKPACNYSKILSLRYASEKFGIKFTIRDVAQLVDWPDMKSQDGFAALRRLCCQLKLPLSPSRQIRKD